MKAILFGAVLGILLLWPAALSLTAETLAYLAGQPAILAFVLGVLHEDHKGSGVLVTGPASFVTVRAGFLDGPPSLSCASAAVPSARSTGSCPGTRSAMSPPPATRPGTRSRPCCPTVSP